MDIALEGEISNDGSWNEPSDTDSNHPSQTSIMKAEMEDTCVSWAYLILCIPHKS